MKISFNEVDPLFYSDVEGIDVDDRHIYRHFAIQKGFISKK